MKEENKKDKGKALYLIVGILGFLFVCIFTIDELKKQKEEVKSVPASLELADIKAKLKLRFNDIGEIEIKPLQAGVLEVAILKNNEVFYTDLSGDYVFLGNLFDSKNVDLTAARARQLEQLKFAEVIKDIDKSKALKVGSGSVEVIEFTDVDCPYCKESESFFADSNAIRYIFFYPLDSIHPEAALKSEHILCSEDKALEYVKVMRGDVREFKSCDKGKELLKVHRDYASKLGVKGTPIFFINGVTYNGANPIVKELVK